MWAMDVAHERGMLPDEMLERMGSRAFTMERARTLVQGAIEKLSRRK
jgi:hypothetical protein